MSAGNVRLRHVEVNDLPVFFEHQIDADAARMADFPSRDRDAFDAHWATNILGNPNAITRTIVVDDQVAGNIGSWLQEGERLVGYWIGREFWGRGVATGALSNFLRIVRDRPIHAHVAKRNAGSIRVLEKCGFTLETDEGNELLFVLR